MKNSHVKNMCTSNLQYCRTNEPMKQSLTVSQYPETHSLVLLQSPHTLTASMEHRNGNSDRNRLKPGNHVSFVEVFVLLSTIEAEFADCSQVTWLTKKGVIYDNRTLQIVGSFDHPMGDGWGLTSADKHIVGSDGTATLYCMDPDTFREVRNVTVRDEGRPIRWLNELEYIRDEIWANVYQTECIARIAPKNGRVTGWLLMHGLNYDLSS